MTMQMRMKAFDERGVFGRLRRWRLGASAALLMGASVSGWSTATAAGTDTGHETTTVAQCDVPDDIALTDGPLPRLARRLKSVEPVTVVVLGSGSATGSGTSGKDAAFPDRLEIRMTKAWPNAKIRFAVLASTGQTAPAMHTRFARDVFPLKPALVIWQTGAADIAGGVSVLDFENALERGIAELRDHGSDVLLMDGQFSPRASLMVDTDAYREAVRWNARRYEVPLLKRYDTMQYWWNNDVFDLDAQDRASQLGNADRIHDCVAALLMRAIRRGIGRGTDEPRS